MSAAATAFWASALLLAYTYAGYPLLIRLWAALFGQPSRPLPGVPQLSILVVAHNEAHRIGERITNLLDLDYPRDRLEIVIASDGSTDGTADIARRYADTGIGVADFLRRRGKPAVLNDVIPRLRGDIVVLMDVRQRIEPDALRVLAAHFADPQIGAVSGELLLHEHNGNNGNGFYWRYEKFIRLHESRADSTIGTTGALYALRRKLFQPVPPDTILDDVLIPMRIARQGYRVLFEPLARAHDFVAGNDAELTRKTRTIAGNFQLLSRELWLLDPLANRLWFQTLSHKACRLLGPAWLATLFASNLPLALDSPFYRECLSLQLLFYALALAGHGSSAKRWRLASVAHSFCLLNWATVLGFCRFLRGDQPVTWRKAEG